MRIILLLHSYGENQQTFNWIQRFSTTFTDDVRFKFLRE